MGARTAHRRRRAWRFRRVFGVRSQRRLRRKHRDPLFCIIRGSHFGVRDIGGPVDANGKPTPIVDEEGRRKHLHDARGTFITTMKIRMPDITNADLAKMTGWSEEDVERIADLYVDHDQVALAWLQRLKRHAVKS